MKSEEGRFVKRGNEEAVRWAEVAHDLAKRLDAIAGWAVQARGHHGIEECSGPGKPDTEWDRIQHGLRDEALYARAALAAYRVLAGEEDR